MLQKALAILLSMSIYLTSTVALAFDSASHFSETFQKAQQGDAFAQYQIGLGYLKGGLYQPKNENLGVDWLTKSAKQNYSYSQRELAMYYLNHAHNTEKYMYWLFKCDELGLKSCSFLLGMEFYLANDIDQSIYFFKRGTTLDQPFTYYFLAGAQLLSKQPELISQAITNLKLAAKYGHAESMTLLGMIYLEGSYNQTINLPEAIALLIKARDLGDANATDELTKLFILLLKNRDVKVQCKKLDKAIKKSQLGHEGFAICLSIFKEFRQHFAVSRALAKLQTNNGDSYQLLKATMDLENAKNTAQKNKQIQKLEHLAKNNFYFAYIVLGNTYREGRLVKQDFKKAQTYYGLACSHGLQHACDQKNNMKQSIYN